MLTLFFLPIFQKWHYYSIKHENKRLKSCRYQNNFVNDRENIQQVCQCQMFRPETSSYSFMFYWAFFVPVQKQLLSRWLWWLKTTGQERPLRRCCFHHHWSSHHRHQLHCSFYHSKAESSGCSVSQHIWCPPRCSLFFVVESIKGFYADIHMRPAEDRECNLHEMFYDTTTYSLCLSEIKQKADLSLWALTAGCHLIDGFV